MRALGLKVSRRKESKENAESEIRKRDSLSHSHHLFSIVQHSAVSVLSSFTRLPSTSRSGTISKNAEPRKTAVETGEVVVRFVDIFGVFLRYASLRQSFEVASEFGVKRTDLLLEFHDDGMREVQRCCGFGGTDHERPVDERCPASEACAGSGVVAKDSCVVL